MHVRAAYKDVKKVAYIAPLDESVNFFDMRYGGTERVVHSLVTRVLDRGCTVHLFAAGVPCPTLSSRKNFYFHQMCEVPLREMYPADLKIREGLALTLAEQALKLAVECTPNIDIVHNHAGMRIAAIADQKYSAESAIPVVSTIHNSPLDLVENAGMRMCEGHRVVSVSDAQWRSVRNHGLPVRHVGTVYNGIPVEAFTFSALPEEYLAFLGRLDPQKGVEEAILTAVALDMPLKIAGKIDDVYNPGYFEAVIKPLLVRHAKLVEYVGEVDHATKNRFLGGAIATLCPAKWPEPFGLVVVESMACGTPVVGTRAGALPETIEPDVSGVTVPRENNKDALIKRLREGVAACIKINRARCREYVEQRFSDRIMAEQYMEVYRIVSHD